MSNLIKLTIPIKVGKKCEKCIHRFGCLTSDTKNIFATNYTIMEDHTTRRKTFSASFEIRDDDCFSLKSLTDNIDSCQVSDLNTQVDKFGVINNNGEAKFLVEGHFFPR
jgi:hypothetical protein